MTFRESPAGDFDGNDVLQLSDVDLLTASIRGMSRLGWLDGMFDLNSDSAHDTKDLRTWVVDLKSTWFGDANLDGEFNRSDLVALLQAGQYEDSVLGNSTWSTGDWNADGEFDRADLVCTSRRRIRHDRVLGGGGPVWVTVQCLAGASARERRAGAEQNTCSLRDRRVHWLRRHQELQTGRRFPGRGLRRGQDADAKIFGMRISGGFNSSGSWFNPLLDKARFTQVTPYRGEFCQAPIDVDLHRRSSRDKLQNNSPASPRNSLPTASYRQRLEGIACQRPIRLELLPQNHGGGSTSTLTNADLSQVSGPSLDPQWALPDSRPTGSF
jgi:hypothetical protein